MNPLSAGFLLSQPLQNYLETYYDKKTSAIITYCNFIKPFKTIKQY